jgi:D-alanyl-lipoteichoic acid acyltransferase DltB (MBOAT superfamily)
MLFVSHRFLELFLPATLAIFFASRLISGRYSLDVLLLGSVVFCATNGLQQITVLLTSILINFSVARLLSSRDLSQTSSKKVILTIGVLLNLLALSYFKYFNFGVTIVEDLFHEKIDAFSVMLPIGISFYTFTQIAFLVDIYRATHAPIPTPSLRTYALFVSYFPHVIAGPIIHWREMIPQFDSIEHNSPRSDFWETFCRGLTLLSIGAAKKLLIADHLAPIVDKGYLDPRSLTFADAWLLTFSYSFQLYFDFSGYTDMAIGISLLFGISLPVNFNRPYVATSIQDFWRRWHITLSRWLRDYVFIPLGGSQNGIFLTLRNLLLTFLIGGLWHGAAWTFIVWGALHGCACCVHRLWQITGLSLARPVAILVTFLFINLTWIFFRAPDLSTAWRIVHTLSKPDLQTPALVSTAGLTFLAIAGIISWGTPTSQAIALQSRIGSHPISGLASGAMLATTILALNTSLPSPFLYFNF